MLLRLTLRKDSDWECVGEARDGREAIALAAATKPDVLILDHQMPFLQGLDALPLIKQASPTTRVVFHTGAMDADLPDRARRAGADAFVPKEFETRRF